MRKIVFVILFLYCNLVIFAGGWCRYYAQTLDSYSSVSDLFELNDTVYLSTGQFPSMVFLRASTGDTILTSSIAGGHSVHTPDGFIMSLQKISANFELEWQIPFADISNIGSLAEIIPYPNTNSSTWIYTGFSEGIIWGDFPSVATFPCIWQVNADGTHSNSVHILANFTETVDWINWNGDNDIATQIDGDGLTVLANCNGNPCLITNVSMSSAPPYNKICYYSVSRLLSLIQASDQSGYVMAGSGASLLKTDLSGNQQWLKFFIEGSIFEEVIATTDGGYLAVGQDTNENIFVVKTDINGNLQWQIKGIGFDGIVPTPDNSTRELALATTQTSDGGYLVGGHVRGWTPPSSGEPNPYFYYPFFLKIDSTGNCRPSAGFTHSVADYNLSITANTSFGADSYLWQFGNGDTSNLAMPAYTYPQPGSYNLCLIARNLCGNDTLCTAVDIATGIAQNAGSAPLQLRLYPNPVQGGGGAFWQLSSLPVGSAAVLKVYNHLGQLVYSCVVASGAAQGMLPVAQWQAGTYWVQLTTPGHALTQKMAVVR